MGDEKKRGRGVGERTNSVASVGHVAHAGSQKKRPQSNLTSSSSASPPYTGSPCLENEAKLVKKPAASSVNLLKEKEGAQRRQRSLTGSSVSLTSSGSPSFAMGGSPSFVVGGNTPPTPKGCSSPLSKAMDSKDKEGSGSGSEGVKRRKFGTLKRGAHTRSSGDIPGLLLERKGKGKGTGLKKEVARESVKIPEKVVVEVEFLGGRVDSPSAQTARLPRKVTPFDWSLEDDSDSDSDEEKDEKEKKDEKEEEKKDEKSDEKKDDKVENENEENKKNQGKRKEQKREGTKKEQEGKE